MVQAYMLLFAVTVTNITVGYYRLPSPQNFTPVFVWGILFVYSV